MKSKETFEIDKQVRATIINGLKCFDEFYIHQNCIEEQDFIKATLINFELKDKTEFLRKYFKYFAGAHEKKDYHKNRKSLGKF